MSAISDRGITDRASRTVAVDLAHGLRAIFGWYWLIIAIIFGGIGISNAVFGNITMSVWSLAAAAPPKYFLLAIGTMLTAVCLPVYIAHGVTRREFLAGAVTFVGVAGLAFGAILMLGYGVEYLAFSAADLLGGLTVPYPVATAGRAAHQFVELSMLCVVHGAVGWLIGTGYYRFGTWGGTALIPVAILPAIGTELAFGSDWVGAGIDEALHLSAPPLPASIAIALGCLLLALAPTYAMVRTVAIRPKKA